LAAANQEGVAPLRQNLPGRILAVDFGLKRVGLAVSDPMQIIAQPLQTITYKSRQDLLNRLVAVVRENEIVQMVIGLPRHMDGSEGEMAKAVRRLIGQLSRPLTIPVMAWDERLSSVQAERALRELGVSYRDKNRGKVDRMAATFILQSYLDSIKR
jgi:putative Holliday junction resolvase